MNYKNTKTIQAHNDRISSLTKLANDLIATGSYDGKVKIWDISKEEKDALVIIINIIWNIFISIIYGFMPWLNATRTISRVLPMILR